MVAYETPNLRNYRSNRYRAGKIFNADVTQLAEVLGLNPIQCEFESHGQYEITPGDGIGIRVMFKP